MRLILPSPYHSHSVLGRVVATVLGIVTLIGLAVAGVLALAILVVGGLAWFVWFRWRVHRLAKRAAAQGSVPGSAQRDNGDVIEGEYVVVHERRDGTN